MPDLTDSCRNGKMQLHGASHSETASSVFTRAEHIADVLVRGDVRCAGLRLDNGIDWLCADLACMLAGIPTVPVPAFFSAAQVAHAVREAGVDVLFGTAAGAEEVFSGFAHGPDRDFCLIGPKTGRRVPAGIAKVTFTSGTTGTPKGVCLSAEQQLSVAAILAAQTAKLGLQKHLCVLPLPVLLENVAGVYAALLSGADIVLPPLAEVGLSGSCGFDPGMLYRAIQRFRPDSMILLPQMLKALVRWLKANGKRVEVLKFVAVGGARTAAELILEARALGLPVYEGYGLSECCSVVALNLPGADCPGSVGRPLPGREIRISATSEIEIRAPYGVQYLGQQRSQAGWISSGDLGAVDAAGYLHVRGRCRQVLVNAFGRNISPEWVESELLAHAGVMQVMVVGDNCPALGALIVPAPGSEKRLVAASVNRCNAALPDYARIAAYRTVEPFSVSNGQLTPNGRTRRMAVLAAHRAITEALYEEIEALFAGGDHDVLSRAHSGN